MKFNSVVYGLLKILSTEKGQLSFSEFKGGKT